MLLPSPMKNPCFDQSSLFSAAHFCPVISNKTSSKAVILRSQISFFLFSFEPTPVWPLPLFSTALVFVKSSSSPCSTSNSQLSCPPCSLLAAASDMARLSSMTYLLYLFQNIMPACLFSIPSLTFHFLDSFASSHFPDLLIFRFSHVHPGALLILTLMILSGFMVLNAILMLVTPEFIISTRIFSLNSRFLSS